MANYIRLPEVIKSTGLPRSTIYKMISQNEFPKQISLGVKSVAWDESEIESWKGSRKDLRQLQATQLS